MMMAFATLHAPGKRNERKLLTTLYDFSRTLEELFTETKLFRKSYQRGAFNGISSTK